MSVVKSCVARDLTHHYGRCKALDSVSFSVDEASIVGVIGANGSGKSTLLRTIAGLQRPTQGSIELLGQDVYSNKQLPGDIGAAIDGFGLWPSWSPRRSLRYLGALAGRSRRAVDQAIEDAGLDHPDRKLSTLSLGNRQRATLAAALVCGRRFVILDEPMNGLDPGARAHTRRLIRRLAEDGATVLLSSHDLHEVETVCDHLIHLRAGRLAYVGSLADYAGPSLEEKFHDAI